MPPLSSYTKKKPPLSSYLGAPTEPQGFLQSVSRDIQERGSKFAESKERQATGQQTSFETGLQLAGQTAGAAGDILFEGLRSITPEPIKDVARKGIETVASKQSVISVVEAYRQWASANPRAAANLAAGANVASILPIGGGGTVVGKSALRGAGKGAGTLANFFDRRLADQVLDEAVRVIKPELTRTQKIELLSKGQAEQGFFNAIKTLPTDEDIGIAEAVKGIVSARKGPVSNIQSILDRIGTVGAQADEGLNNVGIPYNNSQLKAVLNGAKEESRVVFGSEKSIENTYDAVVDEFLRIKKDYPNNVAGLRKSRVAFDQTMRQKFPKVFNNPATTDSARYNAINDIRSTVDNYTADLLPEGHPYKPQLVEMAKLYKGAKNIAVKNASSVNIPTMRRMVSFLRDNPLTAGITGGIVTFGALSGMLTNPILVSTLLLGGTIKLGKTAFTSQSLKKILIRGLRALESSGKNVPESQVMRQLVADVDHFQSLPNKQGGFIKNPLSSADDPLLTEARKYKSAEEFVRVQPKVFHATNETFEKFDLSKGNQKVVWFSDTPQLAKSTETGARGTKNVLERFIDPNATLASSEEYQKFGIGQLKDRGFDGARIKVSGGTDTVIFNPDVIKTKSQLTDIWKKANAKK